MGWIQYAEFLHEEEHLNNLNELFLKGNETVYGMPLLQFW